MSNEPKEFDILFKKVGEASEKMINDNESEHQKIFQEIIELKKIVDDISKAQEYVSYTRT